MLRTMSYYLREANKLKDEEQIMQYLVRLSYDQPAAFTGFKFVMGLVYDPLVNWDLPEGEPPYTPSGQLEETTFYTAMKKFYRFDADVDPNLPKVKREHLFVTTLEYLHPDDAKLLIKIKEKNLDIYPNLTENIARKLGVNVPVKQLAEEKG